MVTDGAARRSGLPLALKFFLATGLCVVIAVALAVAVTWWNGQRVTSGAVERALATSVAVQKEFEARRLEQLQSMVQLVAADASFVKYIAAATPSASNLPGLSEETTTDSVSVPDLLRERQTQYQFDVGIVLDAQANVLARTDQNEAFQESLAADPLVAPALKETRPFSGYWRQGDALYQAAIMPLAQNQDLVGFLLLALRVDDALARKVGKTSGGDIAFWLPRADGLALVASSLEEGPAKGLRSALAARSADVNAALAAAKPAPLDLTFAAENWAGTIAPTAEGAPALGAVLTLASRDAVAAGYRDLLNWLALAGVAALILALLLSYLLSKGILRPVRAMANAAERAAAGDYASRLAMPGKDDLGRLAQAFDALLAELREKSDIQGYVQALARHLPEQGGELAPAPSAVPALQAPVRENLLLLAVDLRVGDAAVSDPRALIASLAEKLGVADVEQPALLHALANGRALVAWKGDHALERSLAALQSLTRLSPTAIAVLAQADVAYGDVAIRGKSTPVVLAPVLATLDRLLIDATDGQILLAKSVADAVRGRFGEAALKIVDGASGRRMLTLVVAALPNLTTGSNATVARPAAGFTPTPTAQLAAGSLFGGRYRIVSVLGAGGMGVVYKAQDLELNDLVALKTIRPQVLADPEQYERLKSELKLARRITHPNVLRTFDIGEVEGRPYISMEYVRGLTLRYLLQETGTIPLSAALRIARQLAAGLGAAHEVGVLHRDIKPENLILESNGNAKLMDFGIARPTRRSEPGQTSPGMFVGTPNYAAPEQLAGEDVDERADIYACGVVFCEMFCGRVPFSGANTMEIYVAQMSVEPPNLSALRPDLPPAIEAVVLKCLARPPGERFQSVAELLVALDAIRL